MLTYNSLLKHAAAFKSLTGLPLAEFDALYERFAPPGRKQKRSA